MGASVKIDAKFGEAIALTDDMIARFNDLEPALKVAAEDLSLLVSNAFRSDTSPSGEKWPELSPATVELRKRKGGGNIRALRGDTGQLLAQQFARAEKDQVVIGNMARSKKGFAYALAQQFGAVRNGVYKANGYQRRDVFSGPLRPGRSRNVMGFAQRTHSKGQPFSVVTPRRAFMPFDLDGAQVVPMMTGAAKRFFDGLAETIGKYVTTGEIE